MGLLDVVKAWQEGREIQVFLPATGEWDTIPSGYAFVLESTAKYRVKPKPIFRWIFTVINSSLDQVELHAFLTELGAKQALKCYTGEGYFILEGVTRKEWEVPE